MPPPHWPGSQLLDKTPFSSVQNMEGGRPSHPGVRGTC